MKKKNWIIEGWDGTSRIFKGKISSSISNENLKQMLRILTARYAELSGEEIIGCFDRNEYKLLEVSKEQLRDKYSCGENPFFTACLE